MQNCHREQLFYGNRQDENGTRKRKRRKRRKGKCNASTSYEKFTWGKLIRSANEWMIEWMSEWAAEQIYTWLFDTCHVRAVLPYLFSHLSHIHLTNSVNVRGKGRARGEANRVDCRWDWVKLLGLETVGEAGRISKGEKRERGEAEKGRRERYRGEDSARQQPIKSRWSHRPQLSQCPLALCLSLPLSLHFSLSSGVTPRSCSSCCSEPLRIFLLLFIYLGFYLLYH